MLRLTAANQNNPTASISQRMSSAHEHPKNSIKEGERATYERSIIQKKIPTNPLQDIPESPLIPELPVHPSPERSPLQKERSDSPLIPLDPKV